MSNLKRQAKKNRVQRLEARVNDLERQNDRLRQQFQMFNKKLAEDLNLFDTRWRVTWEYFWASIEIMRMNFEGELFTEEELSKAREIVLERWKEEAYEQQKAKLGVGQAICHECHHINGAPNFYDEDMNERCPNCKKSDGIFFNKVTEEKDDDVQLDEAGSGSEADGDSSSDSEEARAGAG